MRSSLDCIPCFLRQALEATRHVTDDATVQRDVLIQAAGLISALPLHATPIELGKHFHRVVRDVTGVDDPYRLAKRRDNDRVLALLPDLRRAVVSSDDPLESALQLAASGNAIDLAVRPQIDSRRAFESAADRSTTMEDYSRFRERLAQTDEVLYLGDNAGEIVADRLVVEQLVRLGKGVTFAVRGRPIINDVTFEEASYVGMNQIADVVSTGSDGPGTALPLCLPEFVERFRRARLILAKGQGNFEGLSEEDAPIFFLLQVKCAVVQRELGIDIGKHAFVCPSARERNAVPQERASVDRQDEKGRERR